MQALVRVSPLFTPPILPRATVSRSSLRRLAAVLLCSLLVGGCGEGPTLSAQPRELELSCPTGLVLIHATSFPSGPWHAPVPRGDETFDPASSALPNTAIDAKPTMIVVPGYCIDRQAFVPTPAAGQPAQPLVSREQAEAACRARGLRLCSPYEWELACRGKDLTRYTYGNHYDPRCTAAGAQALAAPGQRCESSYGVYDQLGGAPEWVLGPLEKENLAKPAQMGGLLATEEPAGVDCLTLRLTPAAAFAGVDGATITPANGATATAPPVLAPAAAIRCCGDPIAKSQYILNYDK